MRENMEGWIEGLYREHGNAVFSFLCGMVRDRHEAEDLMQETFARALAAAGGFQRRALPSTWLFTIARNLALNHIRARKKYRGGEACDFESIAAPIDDPMEKAGADDEASAVLAAVSTLADEQREAFLLKVIEGLTYREIAAVTGCPVGTAQSRFHRALSELKRKLQTQGVGK